jgi:uncharacterized membrane protein
MGTQAKDFFKSDEKELILQAIREAELNTSGEIRVHIENHCKTEVLDRASVVFDLLKMQKTKDRNGVLFYLAVKDRKFAIIGDIGINAKVPANFWDEIKGGLQQNFKNGEFSKGLSQGILLAGHQLKHHFKHQKDDVNELSDEISFS